MQVVGETTQQQVWIATEERKIRINEIIIIEDKDLGNLRGEVVETMSYNPFIPLNLNGSLMESNVVESLSKLGYDIGGSEINIAKVSLFTEAPYPVSTGCKARVPEFEEVKDLILFGSKEEGLVLGEIKSTQGMYESLPESLKDIAKVLEGKELSQNGVPFIFPVKEMHQYPHMGIFGGSGSGKSYGIRVLLEEVMRQQVPMLIFDPHYEMEFKGEAMFESRYSVVTLGEDVGVEFSSLTTRDLINLLGASHTLTESMVNAVEVLHKRNDSLLSFTKRIEDLLTALELGKGSLEKIDFNADNDPKKTQRLKSLLDQYGSVPLASVKGIQWRLKRLEYAGLFVQNTDKIELAILSRKSAVIQGPVWLLGVFATYVIGHFYHQRRQYKDGSKDEFYPPFIIVTDEAHNFAPKGYESPSKSVIKEIAQEGRKYGVFLLLATQRPTLLDETVTAQLNTKLIFRTVRGTDIATLREETDLTERECKRLPYLKSGDVFLSSAIFGRTIAARIRVALTESPFSQNPFDELESVSLNKTEDIFKSIIPFLPITSADFADVLKKLEDINSIEELSQKLSDLSAEGYIYEEKTPFGKLYKEK
ncbi:ATP-binding protein [Proteinivorax hydrogeniformans]|uniref:ATP-binding protein n=1 Tax=Proteinivorax hydrogeniformans TaxID=1826727 RepID=A0AAU8HTG6_9FIRM